MARRLLPLAVVVVSLAGMLGSSSTALGDDCQQPLGPASGHVSVDPTFATVTGTQVALGMTFDGNGDGLIADSFRFHITGPDGAVKDLKADRYYAAYYTTQQVGHHTVTATWTYYDCGDSLAQTTATGSAAPTPFDTVIGERATGGVFSTTRRPRRKIYATQTQPGDAALHVGVKCPREEVARHEPVRVDLYWTTNGHPATHSSRHIWNRSSDGCHSDTKLTNSRNSYSKSLNAGASGGIFIDVFEPLRADVLVEIHAGDALIASKRAKFRRSKTGMGVKLKPA